MDVKIQHEWEAERYHLNSGVQQEAAMNLLKLLSINGKEVILDVGCGDGKITAAISHLLNSGSIIGVDASEDMILFASRKFIDPSKKNLKFILQNAQDINYSDQFDIVFSSFALQWVLNIERFFEQAYRSLRQNGRLGCTIPLSISDVGVVCEKLP